MFSNSEYDQIFGDNKKEQPTTNKETKKTWYYVVGVLVLLYPAYLLLSFLAYNWTYVVTFLLGVGLVVAVANYYWREIDREIDTKKAEADTYWFEQRGNVYKEFEEKLESTAREKADEMVKDFLTTLNNKKA